MTKEEALALVKTYEPDFLLKAKKAGYMCPVCQNGSGQHGTGITKDPKSSRFKCFKCGLHEDIVGLWKEANNITDFKEALDSLYRHYGIMVDNNTTAPQQPARKEGDTMNQIADTKPMEDYRAYYSECAGRVTGTDYFHSRGLTDTTIEKYHLGYDPAFKLSDKTSKTWEAAIIPVGTGNYIIRNTDPAAAKEYRYQKRGSSTLYLSNALYESNEPIYIVEGELDALSIIQAGGSAVALGSTANSGQLLNLMKDKKPVQTLILALDQDDSGKETEAKIAATLEQLDIPYLVNPSLYGQFKDANEALVKDRARFTEEVAATTVEAQAVKSRAFIEAKEAYEATATSNHLQSFIDDIKTSVNTPFIPTGFTELDSTLDGGLYEGLYIIGAISSLGKTTLALQIMDQVAEAGHDVLIFSLEMARNELIAKSISRLTLVDVIQNDGNPSNAKTTRGITTYSRYSKYNPTEKALIRNAIQSYSQYAGNIFIHEGIGNIGIEQIKGIVDKHIHFRGKKPVILIDYVQILAPADIRASDKQNTDKAVLELKRLSRDYKIPVVGISSFNRASYKDAVTMEAFKESGSLEYGSDVLIGLQLEGAGKKDFNVDKAKQDNPRKVELVILKNRNGETGSRLSFEYYPMFNYFKEKE